MDLPCEDETAGLDRYRDAVIDAIGERRDDLVLVAHSLGGLTAPLVADAIPVQGIVLVTAMIPAPGETGGDWWANTGHAAAMDAQQLTDTSENALFVHDVPEAVLVAVGESRDQTERIMEEPWPLDAWPAVPTTFLLCMDDRFFPPEWMRGVVRERLGIEPVEVPGSHCPYLSRPRELAEAIMAATSTAAA